MSSFAHRLFLAPLMLAAMVATAAAADPLPAGSFRVAAGGSCQASYRTCAARCKQRAPQDKSCAADHCAPKLDECRATGCWQEGALYGGAKQCGLSK